MESSDEAALPREAKDAVQVAVNIRPLIGPEILLGAIDCIAIVPGQPQVRIGTRRFTYDYVYGGAAAPSARIYDECVSPLVDAVFHGYNATVFAYGQTGSGKTYTMGTNFNGEDNCGGIIPRVMETIFSNIERLRESTEFLVQVSYIEIWNEVVYDLLDLNANASPRNEGVPSVSKQASRSRIPIQIRETSDGDITLTGVAEIIVRSKEEMASCLARGSLSRATGSTKMNSQSSRSHAIFTIFVKQTPLSNNDASDSILSAKLHLVDLAGSERAKRTGTDGIRFREGVNINRGLLVLGNVISALGDEKRRKEGLHVPYRDSKLTRLLQDSLGGNSKTAMIACISPADTNAEETLNTLKYANRARSIQNKAVVNRDPLAAEMQQSRSQEQLQSEVLNCRANDAPSEELQVLRHRICLLEASNAELDRRLSECRDNCERLAQNAFDAQVEKDRLLLMIKSARNGKSWDEIEKMNKILEKDPCIPNLHDLVSGSDGRPDEDEKERDLLFKLLDRELQKLEKIEAEMKGSVTAESSVVQQQYERELLDLQSMKKALQEGIEELRFNLANKSSSSDDGSHKLIEEKLNMLEIQLSELKKKKKDGQSEASRRLQEEIQRIKSEKVQLQHKSKQDSEQLRAWKAAKEKEIIRLKKEGRRIELDKDRLLALTQKQKMVVQRKTEEATLSAKKLKAVMEAKKPSRDVSGFRRGSGLDIQALMHAIENQLEVRVEEHVVRSAYERHMEWKAAWASELAKLKEEDETIKMKNLSQCPHAMSLTTQDSRISAIEAMRSSSSSSIILMASQLSEAADLEHELGSDRWIQVSSVSEAKTIMEYLFNLVSRARCELRDKEVSLKEKDSKFNELKDECLVLRSLIGQKDAKFSDNVKVTQESLLLYPRPDNVDMTEDMDISD